MGEGEEFFEEYNQQAQASHTAAALHAIYGTNAASLLPCCTAAAAPSTIEASTQDLPAPNLSCQNRLFGSQGFRVGHKMRQSTDALLARVCSSPARPLKKKDQAKKACACASNPKRTTGRKVLSRQFAQSQPLVLFGFNHLLPPTVPAAGYRLSVEGRSSALECRLCATPASRCRGYRCVCESREQRELRRRMRALLKLTLAVRTLLGAFAAHPGDPVRDSLAARDPCDERCQD